MWAETSTKRSTGSSQSGVMAMPVKVSLLYGLAAAIWILVSDALMAQLPLSGELREWVAGGKGLAFVGVTAGLLYALLRRWAIQMEAASRDQNRSEKRFRALVQASPVAIFVEEHGKYGYANPATVRLTGAKDAESLVGRDVLEHVVPRMREMVMERMRGVRANRVPLEAAEGAVLTDDGREVAVEITAVPIEEDGEIQVWVLARDISARLASEASRREQQELLQAVIRSTSDAIFVKDFEFRYVLLNESGAKVLGAPVDALIGRTNFDFMNRSQALLLEASDRQVLQTGQTCIFDVPLMVGGQRRHFCVTKAPLLDASGRLSGLVGVGRDMTEQMEAEESLRRLSGMFLRLQDDERRRIARELHDTTAQGLVAVSLGLSEAIRVASEGGEGLEESLAECRVLVDACTRDVRTLSYGLHPPMLDEMGLPVALEEFAKEMAKRSGLTLEYHCATTMRRLKPDAELALFRVAQEALLNVHRHSGSKSVRVSLGTVDDRVELEVRDAGRGIPRARMDQLERGVVVGVGISGMRERLRQLGGRLEITSDGAGTAILARLPMDHAT